MLTELQKSMDYKSLFLDCDQCLVYVLWPYATAGRLLDENVFEFS